MSTLDTANAALVEPGRRRIDAETRRVRACLAEQRCPVCLRTHSRRYGTPFVVIALHVVQAHGIDSLSLRDMAFVFKGTTIASPDHRGATPEERERKRQAAIARRLSERPRSQRQYSRAGRASQLQRMASAQTAAVSPAVVARRAASQRKAHPCASCGAETGTSRRRTCSNACADETKRRANIRAMERRHATHVHHRCHCGAPIPTATPRLCSPGCVSKARSEAARRTNAQRHA